MELAATPAAARGANLRFADSSAPGIVRVRRGKGFAYRGASGAILKDEAHLARIRALAIPPAWENVWICTDPDGHLQATGTDARGRKQYRYHAGWTAHRNAAKFAGLLDFARVLPRVRRRVKRDLALPGMPKDKVLACIVHLLDEVHIRIGNDKYAKENDSYGLTTIRRHHATVQGGEVRFNFRAKSGKQCSTRLHSPTAARIVRRCQDLPGQVLFAYLDDEGATRDLTSSDVNEYLEAAALIGITAKDFRTWGGTVVAAETLLAIPDQPTAAAPLNETKLKQRELAAVRAAAHALSNTVSTCRKFYVHPQLMGWYKSGRLHEALRDVGASRSPRELEITERALAHLMRRSIARVRQMAMLALRAVSRR